MSDIIAMLDTLADYKAQRDLIDIRKRELLDTVKVPAEIIAAQKWANDQKTRINWQLQTELEAIERSHEGLFQGLEKPELPAEYVAAMAEYNANVENLRSVKDTRIRQERELAQRRDALIYDDLQAKTAQVYAELAARKNEIEAEFGEKAVAVDANIAKLKAEIVAATIEHGSTVKGKVLQAVYVKGRTSWNTDKLDGMAEIFPSIKTARTVGNPSVTIR